MGELILEHGNMTDLRKGPCQPRIGICLHRDITFTHGSTLDVWHEDLASLSFFTALGTIFITPLPWMMLCL